MVLPAQSIIASTGVSKGNEIVYLDCTGKRPIWTRSFADIPLGLDGDKADKAKLIIKMDFTAKTATVEGLFGEDEFVFDVKPKPTWYYGSGKGGIKFLDGIVSSSYISLNRINGYTHIGFEVSSSPKDGGKYAFDGVCERTTVKF